MSRRAPNKNADSLMKIGLVVTYIVPKAVKIYLCTPNFKYRPTIPVLKDTDSKCYTSTNLSTFPKLCLSYCQKLFIFILTNPRLADKNRLSRNTGIDYLKYCEKLVESQFSETILDDIQNKIRAKYNYKTRQCLEHWPNFQHEKAAAPVASFCTWIC